MTLSVNEAKSTARKITTFLEMFRNAEEVLTLSAQVEGTLAQRKSEVEALREEEALITRRLEGETARLLAERRAKVDKANEEAEAAKADVARERQRANAQMQVIRDELTTFKGEAEAERAQYQARLDELKRLTAEAEALYQETSQQLAKLRGRLGA